MLKNIDWDDIRANIAIGIGIAAFSGVSYFFTGFGLLQTYDPIKAEMVEWSPSKSIFTSENYKIKIRLVSEFYRKYPNVKVSTQTSQDVLDTIKKYCTARLAGWEKEDMNRWTNLQMTLLVEKGISSDLIAGIYERFDTIHTLAEKYSCSNLN